MKKIIALLLVVLMLCGMMTGCKPERTAEIMASVTVIAVEVTKLIAIYQDMREAGEIGTTFVVEGADTVVD